MVGFPLSPDSSVAGRKIRKGHRLSPVSAAVSYEPTTGQTVLQLSGDGTNGSTDIPDDAGRHQMTANGNAALDTSQMQFGTASINFDGTGDDVTTPDSADFHFAGDDFTVETWARFATVTGDRTLLTHYADANNRWYLEWHPTLGLGFAFHNASGSATFSVYQGAVTGWAVDTWYHIAVARVGTTIYLYRDGVEIASGSVGATAISDYAGTLYVGQRGNASQYFNGHMDEVRIVKGEGIQFSSQPASAYNTPTDLTAFISEWDTTAPSELVTLPHTGTGYAFIVNWGDGTIEELGDSDAPFTHTYATADRYTIKISGTFPRWYFNNAGDKDKIKEVTQWGNIGATSASGAFFGCTNLTIVAGSFWPNVTSLQNTFNTSGILALPADFFDNQTTSVSGYRMFKGSDLATVHADAFSGASGFTNLQEALMSTDITSLPAGLLSALTSLTSMRQMVASCLSLTDIGDNLADNSPLTDLYRFANGASALVNFNFGSWDWSGVTVATQFISGTVNSTDYNASWIALDAQTLQSSVAFGGGGSAATGAGLTARNNVISGDLWTVTDAS